MRGSVGGATNGQATSRSDSAPLIRPSPHPLPFCHATPYHRRPIAQDGLVGCIYRVAQDGLPILLPFLSSQLLELPLAELKQLLKTRSLALPETAKIHITKKADQEDAEGEAPAPARAAALAPETLEAISKIGYGCCIARLRPADALGQYFGIETFVRVYLMDIWEIAIGWWSLIRQIPVSVCTPAGIHRSLVIKPPHPPAPHALAPPLQHWA